MLTRTQFERAKAFIFRHGRLLERKRFLYHFENAPLESVLEVMRCYQNPDGGFGHGIEPDILCPMSTPVSAEAALLLLDELGVSGGPIVDRVESWLVRCQGTDGTLLHPPQGLESYPHAPWHADPEAEMVLSLAGILGKWNRMDENRSLSRFFQGASTFFRSLDRAPGEIYDNGVYAFLRFAPDAVNREKHLGEFRKGLSGFLRKYSAYHVPFHRLWAYSLSAELDPGILEAEAKALVADFQEDGGLPVPFKELPGWRPIWTMHALVGLKRHKMLVF